MSDEADVSRRDLLLRIAAAMGMTAVQVHSAVAQEKAAQKGPYRPQALNGHEYATLERLSGLIVPAGDRSPGAVEAGAAAFIDFLCAASDEMKTIYTGGLAWLDGEMRRRENGSSFLDAPPPAQTALLDLIAWSERAPADLAAGVQFFAWARNMVVDAYYTSPLGMKELGYLGNSAMEQFRVPQEAIDYAVKRSPLE
ncbi:MAG: gluconate 2-dehydrogenase subunit 3 family protein [Acidobacteriia bacterium]|nr:gluconate 2-dehydrogenase subunit 3 family protein [Terriglobia bacterium]